ncbi:MAG: MFS transporter [Thermoplasmatota archaeon]
MGPISRMSKMFRSYSPQYWVVISLELFERGAYYGIMGYFPVHMVRNVGLTGTEFGILYAILLALLYTVPLIASSLARKFGYRTILLFAFILLVPAYVTMTFLDSYYMFFPLIIAWGVGAGAFKPMVSATIAHVTEKEHRNSAYSIYYLSINWGSLLAMVGIGLFIPEAFAAIAFAVGAVLITINLLITFFLYKNPVERNPEEKIFEAVKNLFRVLKDTKFAVLLLIYAGFFFIFSSMHTFLPVYYTEFGLKPFTAFEAPLMSAINPLTIVMLGPFLSRFMDRFQSLKLMITGMFVFSMGLFLLGMFPAWYTMAIGIFIFSIGEFMTHPNFISYVSKIAPEDKVALYMGYAFIPSAIGNVVGSVFGGVMWDGIAVKMEQPSYFWGIYVAIGFITIGNFLIYNKLIAPKKTGMAVKKDIFTFRYTFLAAWAIAPILIFAGFSMGTLQYVGSDENREDQNFRYELTHGTVSFDGTLTEGASDDHMFTIEDPNVVWISINLTWQDQPDQSLIFRTYTNTPDSFRLSFSPLNASVQTSSGSNQQGEQGTISIYHEYPGDPDFYDGTGEHSLTVTLTEVGPYDGPFNLGFLVDEDTGNDYSIQVQYARWVKVTETAQRGEAIQP